MKAKVTLIVLIFFQLTIKVWGQNASEEYLFKSLEVDLGLSNSNVLSIFKDSNGFMWFGTANGLNRFDGTKMKTFYSDDRDSSALSNNYISRIYEGPEKTLWIKNVNGIFEVYLPDTENFERNIRKFSQKYHLKSEEIKMLYKDGGRYWFVHPFEGISIYDSAEERTIYLTQKGEGKGGLSTNQVSSVARKGQDEYWIVHQNGILDVFDGRSGTITGSISLQKFLDSSVNYDLEILIDSEQDAWIYSPDHNLGLIYIDGENREARHVDEHSSPLRLNNNLIKGLIEHRKGEIWVGTDHGGINVIDKKKEKVSYIMNDPGTSQSLSHNAIYALYKDSDDIVWIGTYKKGINYYHPGLMNFRHVRNGYSSDNSLPYNDVNVFVEDSLGNLYIGTNGGGLYYQDKNSGNYTKYVHDPSDPESISGNVIVDLAMDEDGILWVGTYLNGLNRFDGKAFVRYMPEPNNPNSLSDINVWKIHVDRKNRVWVGTLRGGLNLWDRQNEHFRRFPVGGDPFEMNNQYISSFAEDRKGNLWVGGGYGIDVINVDTGFHHYYSASHENGLKGNSVTELWLDSQGVIWIATSQGLNYFDSEKKEFQSFSTKDGLPTDYLVSILEDDEQNFWLSTQNGLSYAVVNRDSNPYHLNFRNFDERDGLQAALFNKNAAFRSSDGEFLFGGPNGYNVFKSENFAFALNEPEVVFTGFQLFNTPVGIGEELRGRKILEKSFTETEAVSLKHDENIFSVEFSALNFIHLEKNKFRYKLMRFNEEWTTLLEPPFSVTYTNLDPGTYRLVVQPANNDGHWSEREYSRTIIIQAPFWKTPLAYVVYAILALMAVFFARKQLLAKERENFRRLEEKREAHRIKELDKMKTRFFTNISHEFRTPLTLILTPVERLLQEEPEPEKARQYLTIQRNGKRLLQLVNQLLDIKNIEKKGLSFNPSEGDVIAFIEDRVHAFVDLSEKKHIELRFTSELEAFTTRFDEDKLEKILFNLLSNAFKFTPDEGKIEVDISLLRNEGEECPLCIRIKDTGIGIHQQDLPRIFERYYTSDHQNKVLNQGSGIGLSLALEFAKLHGGDIEVISELGKGTTFFVRLVLPVKEGALQKKDTQEEGQNAISDMSNGKQVILLAEDNEEFRHYLADCLSEEFNVT